MRHPVSAARGLLPLSAVLVLAACGNDSEEHDAWADVPPGHTVRDSAGIEIVESTGPEWSPDEAWRLSRRPVVVLEASDGNEENLLLDPASVDEDRRGRIIVADGDQAGWDAVLVFDSDGDPLFRAGREGEGPGEFGQLWWAEAYRGDSIVAYDMARDQVLVFGPDGEYARFVPQPRVSGPTRPPGTSGYADGVSATYPDGSFLGYSPGALDISGGPGRVWYRHLLLRVAPDGESWDTLGMFPVDQYTYWDGQEEHRVGPYAPYTVRGVHGDELYFGTSEDFEVSVYGPQGGLRRIVRRTHDPKRISEDDAARFRTWYAAFVAGSPEGSRMVMDYALRQLEEVPWPGVMPAYSALLVDPDGNLWVEEYRWLGDYVPPDPRPAHWSVFDPDGVWLGQVEVPARFILKDVTRERAYGIVVDELDVEEVHAYRIIKP